MKNLKFEDLPIAVELTLEKLETLGSQLSDIKEKYQLKEPGELMTWKEVSRYLRVNLSTI